MKINIKAFMATALALICAGRAGACTGITLNTRGGQAVLARTIEWAGSNLNSCYVIVPRGYSQQSYIPGGTKGGMEFASRYGYVGLAVETAEFVAEGINEEGLSAGLFYFPGYGMYEEYDPAKKDASLSDLQLVPWLLGQCRNVDEVMAALKNVHVVATDARASTAHWRIADASGRQVVLEIVDRKPRFYENKLGVLTNSPGFDWQTTNLNNYINLAGGTVQPRNLGEMQLSSFGSGTAMLGLPGDITPPSRFVRAAFFQATAPVAATTEEAVRSCFQILNNFDIPVGVEFAPGHDVPDIPSATQWTSVTDIARRKIYYRTMYNSAIRYIDLNAICFDKVKWQTAPLDEARQQPFMEIKIK